MASSALYVGERGGARLFKIGRVGFDVGSLDAGLNAYTGTLRSERIFPAGPGGLVNFRRVVVHLMTNGSYEFTVKVWVDDRRTRLGDGSLQNITIAGSASGLSEVSEEIEIDSEGSHIQVEINVDSDDVTGIFLIESVMARGRIIRQSSTRSGEAE